MKEHYYNLLGKEKFRKLARLPIHIGLMVGYADGEFDKKEQKAMDDFINKADLENQLINEIFHYVRDNLESLVKEVITMVDEGIFEEDILSAKVILDEEISSTVRKNFLIGLFALGIYVANASGGFLGFNKISKEEYGALEFFKDVLDIKEEWWDESY